MLPDDWTLASPRGGCACGHYLIGLEDLGTVRRHEYTARPALATLNEERGWRPTTSGTPRSCVYANAVEARKRRGRPATASI